MRRKLILLVLGLFGALLITLGVGSAALSRPLPEGEPTADADAAAQALIAAVNEEAWERTGAVTWGFAGRHTHLWDRQRTLHQLVSDGGDTVVRYNLTTMKGVATVKGETATPEKTDKLIQAAYAAWINDSFWLNPVVKAFDEGTVRIRVPLEEGGQGVMVQYRAGGLTPGDSYLWIPGPEGRPKAWRMWVSIIPIGGLEATWEGWIQLSTGAWVSTVHQIGPMTLTLTDVSGAASVMELLGEDPFVGL